MIKLPKDTKSYVIKSVTKKLLPFLILELIFGLTLVFFGEKIFITKSPSIEKFGYVVFMLIPVLITGMPFKLIDSSWCGEIVYVEVKTVVDTFSRSPGRPELYENNIVYITVKRDNGKFVYTDAMHLGEKGSYFMRYGRYGPDYYPTGKIEYFVDKYKVGDRIYKFYGVPYMLHISKSSDKINCVICNTDNSKTATKCSFCNHTLIK